MKNTFKITLFVLLLNIVTEAKAGNKGINPVLTIENNTNVTDSSLDIKSNIIIFKIISTPTIPATNNNSNPSLKKAGKVARTSNTHTSIDTLLFKKKGI